jgi:TRAP-type uncharacterized transport system substrate-binding protein
VFAAFAAGALAAPAAETTISIGTGRITSVYYPTGGAICQLVNASRSAHGIDCSVERTDGSIHNLSALRTGEIDLAVVQSDWQRMVTDGLSIPLHPGAAKYYKEAGLM